MKMIKIIFLIFIIANLFQPFAHGSCPGLQIARYKIHVINLLPKNSAPMTLHCASGDNDLGFHQLRVGDDFHWSFCRQFFGKTLFFCHLWWNGKEISFDVYNEFRQNDFNLNVWAVKSDGIYFTKDRLLSSLKKFYSW